MEAGVKHHIALSIVGVGSVAGQRLSCEPRSPRKRSSGKPAFPIRSCAPHSSWNFSAASPKPARSATRLASVDGLPAADRVGRRRRFRDRDAALAAPAQRHCRNLGARSARVSAISPRATSRRWEIPAPSSQIRMLAISAPNWKMVRSSPTTILASAASVSMQWFATTPRK